MSASRGYVRWATLVVCLVGLSACGDMSPKDHKGSYIGHQTAQYLFDQSCEATFEDADHVLYVNGFSPEQIESDLMIAPEDDTRVIRDENPCCERIPGYRVRAIAPDEETCRIEAYATETKECRTARTQSRDLDLEWEILQRANPERAEQIEREAEQYADRQREEDS